MLSISGELIVSKYIEESITTDCKTFWPRRPLSTAYQTKDTVVKQVTYSIANTDQWYDKRKGNLPLYKLTKLTVGVTVL